jgi:hypothetical protein
MPSCRQLIPCVNWPRPAHKPTRAAVSELGAREPRGRRSAFTDHRLGRRNHRCRRRKQRAFERGTERHRDRRRADPSHRDTEHVEQLVGHLRSDLCAGAKVLNRLVHDAESRAELARLAEEQAALRRLATLVARGTPPEEVFAAVTEEVVRVLPVDLACMGRYESNTTVTFVAASGGTGAVFPVGGPLVLEGRNVSTVVAQTGRAARIDNYAGPRARSVSPSARAASARRSGRRSPSRAVCGA